jgi:hypothetical protein
MNHFPTPNLITFDVYGYYAYLPAAITYGDLTEFKFVDSHFSDYALGSGNYQVTDIGNHRIPIYTMGLAILVAPFYLIAEVIALIGGLPRDGLSQIYQWMFLLSSIFYCWLGFYFLSKWLFKYFKLRIVWVLAVMIAFGTNYLVYASYEIGLTHTYIFCLYCILLFYSEKWALKNNVQHTCLIAMIIGVLCLIRPTEIISILIPLGYSIHSYGFNDFVQKKLRHLLLMVAIGMLIILPQMALWKVNTGHWIFNAYMDQNHSFDLLNPHIFDGLFSYRKGWLIYSPVMFLSLIGFWQLYHKSRSWFWPILLYLVIHIFITFSWSMWWYASSFGSRPMIHAYAALALPFGFLFEQSKKKSWLLAIISVFAILNLLQSWQYTQKILPGDGINKVFYWKTFGKVTHEPENIKYVDLEEALPGLDKFRRSELASLNWSSFYPPDTTREVVKLEGQMCERIDQKRTFSYPLVYHLETDDFNAESRKNWLLVEADLYLKGDSFDAYNAAQLGISFHHDGQKIHEDGIRFPFHLKEGNWAQTEFEIRLPPMMTAGDMIKVFVWNPSPDSIYVRRLSLQRLGK